VIRFGVYRSGNVVVALLCIGAREFTFRFCLRSPEGTRFGRLQW
jgi:hypothetical protein